MKIFDKDIGREVDIEILESLYRFRVMIATEHNNTRTLDKYHNKLVKLLEVKGAIRVTPQELASSLKELDKLYTLMNSFSSWLSGDDSNKNEYERIKTRIESSFPGLRVVQVNLTYKSTHALVAND